MDPDEKPFKKARFLWEVKGKHHLRARRQMRMIETHHNNNYNLINNSQPSTSKTDDMNGEQHFTPPKYTHKYCCINNFLKKTEAMMDDSETTTDGTLERNYANEIDYLSEFYMEKWQAKRVARAYVDNTINSVLERYMLVPLEEEEPALGIEEDAISFAIEAHGLQQPSEPRIDSANIDVVEPFHSNSIREDAPENIKYLHDNDNVDFMQEAVSVAILEKGLSYGS